MSSRGRNRWPMSLSSISRSWSSSATASSRPSINWDDYKGVDLKGKTLVMLVGDPPVPDPAESVGPRSEDVWRERDDLLRPVDVQVRDRSHERRGRRADRSRNRPGGLRLQRHPGQDGGAVRSRDARQEHGTRRDRRLDHARAGDEAAADVGPGLRRAQEAGGHARVQAGAARCHRVDDDTEHAPDDRLEERDGEARRVGSGAERRVRGLHGSLGSFRKDRRRDLPWRPRQRVRHGGTRRDRPGVHEDLTGRRSVQFFSSR